MWLCVAVCGCGLICVWLCVAVCGCVEICRVDLCGDAGEVTPTRHGRGYGAPPKGGVEHCRVEEAPRRGQGNTVDLAVESS